MCSWEHENWLTAHQDTKCLGLGGRLPDAKCWHRCPETISSFSTSLSSLISKKTGEAWEIISSITWRTNSFSFFQSPKGKTPLSSEVSSVLCSQRGSYIIQCIGAAVTADIYSLGHVMSPLSVPPIQTSHICLDQRGVQGEPGHNAEICNLRGVSR